VLNGDGVNNNITTLLPHSGTYAADLGQTGSPGILQQVLTTPAADTYTLSFWLAVEPNGPPNEFEILWNGTTVLADMVNMAGQAYQEYIFSGLTSLGGSDVSILTFSFQNDPGFFHLDDVSVDVAAVPLPPSALLLGSGLLGLVGLRRRFKK
jgi:hypothetical protein